MCVHMYGAKKTQNKKKQKHTHGGKKQRHRRRQEKEEYEEEKKAREKRACDFFAMRTCECVQRRSRGDIHRLCTRIMGTLKLNEREFSAN